MKSFLCLFLALMSVSCATIFNSTHCTTAITTSVPTTAIIDADTMELEPDKSNIVVSPRSKNPRHIILIKDAKTDTITLFPIWSEAYHLNFWTIYGFIIDGKTSKKWSYPRNIHLTDKWIENNRIAVNISTRKCTDKGTLNFQLGFPYVNQFCLRHEIRKSSSGFMGIALGLDYFYKDQTFLNISGNGIANIFIPFPAAVDYGGIWDHMYSGYVSASNNHMLFKDRFSFGYGLSYGHDTWNTINHGRWDDDAPEDLVNQKSVYRKSNSLGLVFPFYYYIKRRFHLGAIYRPMLVQFEENTRFKYQHTISLEFGWRFQLNK